VKCKQRKRERQTTFGSIDIKTGKMVINFADKGNYQSFKKHLKKVLWEFKDARKIIMILDNVRYHHAKLLKKFLAKHDKIELMYLPAYSPDLNPIERAWWYMRKSITHNRYILSLKERKVNFWQMFSHFQKPNDKILNICAINY
jgi:transposase